MRGQQTDAAMIIRENGIAEYFIFGLNHDILSYIAGYI